MVIIEKPRWRWIRTHRFLSTLLAVVVLAGLILGGNWSYERLFPRALSCGDGTIILGSPAACIGINLTGGSFTATEPPRMRSLETMIKNADDTIAGAYVSVVLLLDLSPVASVDTVSNNALYSNIEGAITAVWRANDTAALGNAPKVKLFLANMGSMYDSWSDAVNQITVNAAAAHVTSVIGLGQSTDRTRRAAAMLSQVHIPTIGSTVTADTMNFDPSSGKPIANFFRVSPTNSDSVLGAAKFISAMNPRPYRVAIVQDSAPGDDYTRTLAHSAVDDLHAPGRTINTLSYRSPTNLPAGVKRQDELKQQFHLLHDNLCQDAPEVVYFAGRGADLGAFVQNWVQDAPCGFPGLTIVSGDDAAASINDPNVDAAIAANHVKIYYTALASPDEWGSACTGKGSQTNYNQFWAAFTGRPDPCTGQTIASSPGTTPLAFDPVDLESGQAMLAHDAAFAAIEAARQDGQNGDLAFRDPESQTGILDQLHCVHMIPGASGWIAFGSDGNPIDKPIPVVQIASNGTIRTVLVTWTSGVELVNFPTPGQVIPGVC
jgi:hypothetical protein